jgi:hypothetical protein
MKVLSFDVESNGLHGSAFAVAGVVIGPGRRILSQFIARCPIEGPVDPWVTENVLEPMVDIAETHPHGRGMRDAFWAWYLEAKAGAGLIVAANPYPVEARFLIACQSDDMAARSFDHPFPYYDLSSMLYILGIITPPQRRDFVAKAVGEATGKAHNPLWDAKATALAALLAADLVISKNSEASGTISTNAKEPE